MKLLLIQPSKYLEVEGGLYGLAALATYVEKYCEVRVFNPNDSLADTVIKFNPDIVGVTASTLSYNRAIDIMKAIRLLAPKALRIVGGPHISCLPESLDPVFDVGVVGDGEETLLDIVRNCTKNDAAEIPGTCHREGNRTIINPRQPPDLDTLPIPKLHTYAPQSYKHGIVGFITSRGCPFNCVFCYSKVMREKVSYHSLEWVADQFEYVTKTLRAKFLVLWDDNVCLDLNRLVAIAQELEHRQINEFELCANLRSSIVSDELCQVLQRLHVHNCFSGFESGSDRVLKAVKGQDSSVDKHKETIRLAHKYGINLTVNFMLGMPEEKIEDMKKTLDLISYIYDEKRAGRFHGRVCVNMAIPFPGTYWWKIAEARGVVSNRMDWKKLRDNPESALLLSPEISLEEWRDICKIARSKVEEAGDIVVWN